MRYTGWIVLIWLSACAPSGDPVQPACQVRAVPRDFAVGFEDPALAEALSFGRLESSRCPRSGSLQVRVSIHNHSERTLQLCLQLEFLDATSSFYGDRTTRRVLTLGPHETEWFEAESSREKACEPLLRVGRP